MPRTFPDEFLFGAATAAYQIEGAAFEDGRTASIWDHFSRLDGAVINADNGDVATDHYHRYADDVKIMKELGLQTYRFSTSWSRVRPDGGPVNQKGIDFYSRLVDELLGAGILPWLTLHHWDMPQALEEKGGWTSRDTVDRFVEYALSVHDALGDRVTKWTTHNEPWCSSFLSYTGGEHAPGRQSILDGMLASHHLLLSHGRTVQELRARDESLDFGITLNLTNGEPVNPEDPADVNAARKVDGQFNRWFLDPIFRGEYPADVIDDIRAVDADAVDGFLAAVQPGDLEVVSTKLDFLGVNYYHGEFVTGSVPENPAPKGEAPSSRPKRSPFPAMEGVHWAERGYKRTNMNWEVDFPGLTNLLNRVWQDYAQAAGTPLYVTENGASYTDEVVDGEVHDEERAQFVRGHVAAVLDAIEAGTDVRGYFYWSLLDNYEWAWGYAKRFGIVRVDYDTQVRTIKDSGKEYARIIAARSADAPSAV